MPRHTNVALDWVKDSHGNLLSSKHWDMLVDLYMFGTKTVKTARNRVGYPRIDANQSRRYRELVNMGLATLYTPDYDTREFRLTDAGLTAIKDRYKI
jgi:hypothetical protein